MKKISVILLMAMMVFASCQKESTPVNKGVEMKISARVAGPAEVKASYEYISGTQAGTIATSWEATEKITVISIGEAGISAVDEFTSTGTAGREIAEFTGTWTGKEGDKVICISPAISTSAGASRFSGVAVNSASIGINFPTHSYTSDVNSIKDYDILIGDVNISGSKASVELVRQIAVLKLGFTGNGTCYDYWQWWEYRTQLGIAAFSSAYVAKLFATHGTLAATKASYTGSIVTDTYHPENRSGITYIQDNAVHHFYAPVLANGTLEAGDHLCIYSYYNYEGEKQKGNNSLDKTITSSLSISPGYVYALNFTL